jgi:redox-sensitive bicupin YhaK (pirin superfamily)
VDVEGFSMHPHRGFDIWTYVLEGSHGFMHRDSMGGSQTYRGGSCQFMRTGRGVMHEEFFETRENERTNIELFQIWYKIIKFYVCGWGS